jgi:hypothetical protein
MSLLPVIYRIDQKEKSNGAIQGNGSIMVKKLDRWSVGRLHDRQYQSKGFGYGFARWRSAVGNALGKSK